MSRALSGPPRHPLVPRRTAIQAGSLGLLGLGLNHLDALRAAAAPDGSQPGRAPRARACIYI
ncbi:MAG TPA: hypothetical protein VGX76_20760, partial [Pirellulales bacterium]|nr:hypothetical protein [Pirellulales bacterium]